MTSLWTIPFTRLWMKI